MTTSTELTNTEKIAAFELLIEAIETKYDCDGMCGMIRYIWADGEIETDALVYVEGVIKEDLYAKNETILHYDAYLFSPPDGDSRIAWCEQKIAQLKS